MASRAQERMARPGSTQAPAAWARFSALLEPVHDEARLFARRIARSDAEGDDLFHEAVLRAHARFETLRDPQRFRPWLLRIVTTVHRSRWRRGFWRRMVSFEAGETAEAADPPEVEARAGAERARRALARLPAAQREAIVLFELHGYSVEEVAALSGASVSAVKSRLSRGRARLRSIYQPTAEDEAHEYSRA